MCKVLYTIMGVCGERRVGHVFFLRSGGGGDCSRPLSLFP